MTISAPERGDYAPSLLSYTEFTGNVSITATSEATATTIVTAPALTFDGATGVEIEFFTPDATLAANAAGNALVLVLYDGAASIGFLTQVSTGATTFLDYQLRPLRRLTPSAAAHTYSVRGYRSNANCTINAGVGGLAAFVPGWLKVSRF